MPERIRCGSLSVGVLLFIILFSYSLVVVQPQIMMHSMPFMFPLRYSSLLHEIAQASPLQNDEEQTQGMTAVQWAYMLD